jgi:hypothetical protein
MNTNGHEWAKDVAPTLAVMDCGGKQTATPLWPAALLARSAVVAAL